MTEKNGPIHNQVAELLSAYIDGEVTPGERALVETHVTTCAACAHGLATLRQTVALLRQMPLVAAPRPFTLREIDVGPIRPGRSAWWRLPWTQGLVAAAAMLLCVVVVGGVLLLGQAGKVGAPTAPEPIAMQAPAATQGTVDDRAAEKVMEAEVGAEKEVEKAVEAPAPPPAAEKATDEFRTLEEAQAERAPAEVETLADEGEILLATPSPEAAAGAAPVPAAAPTHAPEATAIATSPALTPSLTLLEAQDLTLEIEPGVIRVSGRLPLPEGRKLLAELWRDGHPTKWATPESQYATVEANGQFTLELRAQPEVSDFDLFAVEPANYELRIRPVDPPAPLEARIPFDTLGPPPPLPTSSP